MTSAVAMISPKFYGFDPETGNPLAFGKVYTYAAGTNTPKASYASEDAAVANPNPVILNAAGYANIYLQGSYKIVVKDADDVEVWTADPVSDASSLLQPWIQETAATQVAPNQFKVTGNKTDVFRYGRAVKLDDTVIFYATVTGSAYMSGETTVTIDAVDNLTSDLSRVWASLVDLESMLPVLQGDAGDTLVDAVTESLATFQPRMERRFNLLLARSGYEFVGSYQAGVEITEYNQMLRDAAGELWRAAATTTLPYTTDGTGLPEGGAFVAVGDADIRNDLAAGVGAGKGGLLVRGAVIYVDTIADLQALPPSGLVDGQQVQVNEHQHGTSVGGGAFVWDSSAPKAGHDGVIVHSPTVPFNGELTGVPDYLNAVGETDPAGAGCFVRVLGDKEPVRPTMAGAISDNNSADAQTANNAALNKVFAIGRTVVEFDGYYYTSQTISAGDQVKWIYGLSEDLTGIECTDSAANVLDVNDLDGGNPFLKVESFRLAHATKGSGDGLNLIGNVSNFYCERVSTVNCRYGTNSTGVPYMQRYVMCRSVLSDEGWHIDASSGNGTTVSFQQCYASSVVQPFWLRGIAEVLFDTPTWDMTAGSEGMIKMNNCGLTVINNLHLEGESDQALSYIVGLRGSNCREAIVNGLHTSVSVSAESMHIFDCRTTSGKVNITAEGVDADAASGLDLIYGSNESGGRIRLNIPLASSTLGAATGQNVANVSGAFVYRRPASGTSFGVGAGEFIFTGIDKKADVWSVGIRNSVDAIPSVQPVVTTRVSLGSLKVRYYKLTDGTEDFGTYDLVWRVE